MSVTPDHILTTKCNCARFDSFTSLSYEENVVLVTSRREDPHPNHQLLASWIVRDYSNLNRFTYLTAYMIQGPQVITSKLISRDYDDSTYLFDGEVDDIRSWINMMEDIISKYIYIGRHNNVVEFKNHKVEIDINDWTERDNYPKNAEQLRDRARVIVIRGPRGIGKTTLAKYLLRFNRCNIISDTSNPGNGESNVIYENRYVIPDQLQQQLNKYPDKIIIITLTEDININKLQNTLDNLLVINIEREPYNPTSVKSMECTFP